MFGRISQVLTQSIDEITRRWVDSLRLNSRTEVHKQLLSADIVDGVKAMIANLAKAIEAGETPDGETLPLPLTLQASGDGEMSAVANPRAATKPLPGPLSLANSGAATLGRLRHSQGYDIQEVIFEHVKLRQEVWAALGEDDSLQQAISPAFICYVDRLLDELMLTTVESFYNISVRDLEKRAVRDPLTQLYNKDYFHQRLNEEMRRSIRYAEPLSIVMIDMDLLKQINDSFGHPAGDQAIRAIARTIQDSCRQTDVPARYGGDEFAVILPETSKHQARAFAERLVRAVQSLAIVLVPVDKTEEDAVADLREQLITGNLEGKAPVVVPTPTISVGFAAFPEDARNPETLLARADAALYRAKNEGRNRIGV